MMRLARVLMLACLVSADAPAFAQSSTADKARDKSAADIEGSQPIAPPTLPAAPSPNAPSDVKPYAVDAPNEGSETAALVG
ncbi:MAG: hypothetical protein H7Z43_00180 [Clostridia bacterium]|nr:hypothetical protein [Deltaproteobacteria bacterium]